MPNAEILAKQLRGVKYDPTATKSFELMSGGFIWSDERPENYDDIATDYAFRYLSGYRASLIRGMPRHELSSVWDAVRAACPDWPGFRAERSSTALTEELDRESALSMRRLDAFDRLCNRKARTRSKQ